jgi:hypothetical protein
MATQLFLRSTAAGEFASTHRGDNTAKLNGVASGWQPIALVTTRGAGTTNPQAGTVAGPTSGLEIASTAALEWITDPLDADVTISGAVTGNIWASENNMGANVAINFVVDVIDSATGTITEIVKSARTTEVAVTTRAVNNFTATPASGVACKRGDRLRVRIFGDDAGTMASGFTFNIGVGGATGGADGDTYVSFTETFSFEAAPSGSVLYLTDTASDVNPGGSVEKEAWTSRGSGSTNAITNTAAGWTSPIQVTNTAGGTVIEWYTKALAAFTLEGLCRFNIRALESNAAANASLAAEVAVTASDGSSPTVLGISRTMGASGFGFGELATTDSVETIDVGVDTTSITEQQRLRFRIYVDDVSFAPLVTGHTVTVTYNGTSAAAAGDTYVTLPQSISEFVAAAPSLAPPPFRQTSPLYRL